MEVNILNRRSGEHESVATAQPLYRLGSFGAPILDSLGLVEHHDVRREPGIDVKAVGHHLFVVDDGEKGAVRGLVVGLESARPCCRKQSDNPRR